MKFNLKHQTHYEGALKFLLLLCVLLAYFFYLSYKHDFSKGGLTVALTWSFFVLCTPVADAGFLVDFPIRLLFGFRMFVVEIFVWILAFFIIFITLIFSPEHYQVTLITRVLYKIITHPYPYWSIIILCCIGTFASIYFGDEMMDVIGHHERVKYHKHGYKYKAVALVGITLLVVSVYYQLLNDLGIYVKS